MKRTKKICLTIIAGSLLICLFAWSSYNLDSNSYELLRSHQLWPAKLFRPSRLLCWVMTVDLPANFKKRLAVKETWGRRCDKLLMVTNGTQLSEGYHYNYGNLLRVPLERDGRDQLWHKVVAAFTYIYEHYFDHYDWFMKADDDTYVLVDHLKQFLRHQDANDNIYFGARFKPFVKQGYMSGGAGYVLSRMALRLLVERGFAKRLASCHLDRGKVEDVEMGLCLEAVGVLAGDTRDDQNRETFLPMSPADLMRMDDRHKGFWYFAYDYYGNLKMGQNSLTKKPISFHYIEPKMMYFIDYLIYNVKR